MQRGSSPPRFAHGRYIAGEIADVDARFRLAKDHSTTEVNHQADAIESLSQPTSASSSEESLPRGRRTRPANSRAGPHRSSPTLPEPDLGASAARESGIAGDAGARDDRLEPSSDELAVGLHPTWARLSTVKRVVQT